MAGVALVDRLDDLADLRIAVFRDFPYLYDGAGAQGRAYERDYLSAYARSGGAVIVGAFAGDRLVGAATAAPMADHAGAFAAPFAERGMDLSRIFYFGESVLLPQWRGHGIGHAFFDRREAAARAGGFAMAAFCAVIRPADHPARPADYSPLDPFWRRRGFAPVDGLIARFDWKAPGDDEAVAHDMQFWVKVLA
ncbi:GNAT family N-acetyltransferase [Sphingobium aquiterrae]|uniref:GNAT family N-acetyltransferase n=1 Tax=Sphingobium aquiterrae TaxID=2038656 RepID=UPI00301682B6